MAFTPRFAATLRGDDGHPRVLVGRDLKGGGSFLPLLIDPDKRKAEILSQRLTRRLTPWRVTAHEGELYWITNTIDLLETRPMDISYNNRPRMYVEKFGAPDYREHPILFNDDFSAPIFTSIITEADLAYPLIGFVEKDCFGFKISIDHEPLMTGNNNTTWQNVPLNREIELNPGEALDLGKITIPKAAKKI